MTPVRISIPLSIYNLMYGYFPYKRTFPKLSTSDLSTTAGDHVIVTSTSTATATRLRGPLCKYEHIYEWPSKHQPTSPSMSICMMKPIVLQYESSVRPIALCTYELSLHTHASLYTDALENPPPKNVPTECQSYIIQITHTVPIWQLSLCRPHILMHLKILGPVFEATRLLSYMRGLGQKTVQTVFCPCVMK